ncbi:undecaprenyl-phosphate galactose phosphotransferase WbaP [Sporomusa acidovorans]|uniref:undecaprenyl-phosphate galactose phosphotransferase WbaP n=1 Tax=Sporomusa acidovorans TaxID=112900 RepID=UPI001FE08C82|nr:undecaprenyl-phosphate galactose phosphotransferase WbaP [Sporomusa acidovorans]
MSDDMPPETETLVLEQRFALSNANRIGKWIAPIVLFCVDYGAVVAALLSALFLRDKVLLGIMPQLQHAYIPDSYIFFLIPIMYLGFLLYEGLYSKRLPFWQCVEIIFKSSLFATLMTASILYFTGVAKETSRLFILFSWIFSFLYLSITRHVTKKILLKFGLWQKSIVVIGAGRTAELLAKTFNDEPGMGYKIVGFIEDKDRPLLDEYPHLGSFSDVEQVIQTTGVQDAVIAVPGLEREQLLNLVCRIQPYVRNLTIVPDLFGVPLSNMTVETSFNERMVMLNVCNNLAEARNRMFKRIFDLLIGIPILITIVPVLIILSIIVKIDSPGPVLHIAKRLGKNGQEFLCYKFRTMYENSDDILLKYFAHNSIAEEEWNNFAKLKGYDPRVTHMGKWLRKFSLDELPQIFNVLKGEMSLVGPRPYLPREKEKMGYFLPAILQTVPGITGLWQISGRNEIDFNGRLRMDEWYVRNWSMWHDIVMLIKTIKVVVTRKGAY